MINSISKLPCNLITCNGCNNNGIDSSYKNGNNCFNNGSNSSCNSYSCSNYKCVNNSCSSSYKCSNSNNNSTCRSRSNKKNPSCSNSTGPKTEKKNPTSYKLVCEGLPGPEPMDEEERLFVRVEPGAFQRSLSLGGGKILGDLDGGVGAGGQGEQLEGKFSRNMYTATMQAGIFFRTKKYVSVTSVLIPSLSLSPAKALTASSSAIRSASSISSSEGGDGGDEEEEDAVIRNAANNGETNMDLILGLVVRVDRN